MPQKENTPIKNIDYMQVIEILKKLEKEDKLTTLVQVKGLIFNLFLFAYSQNISKDSTIHYRIKAYTSASNAASTNCFTNGASTPSFPLIFLPAKSCCTASLKSNYVSYFIFVNP